MSEDAEKFLFIVETPLKFTVRCTAQYWELIVTVKHPVMADKLELVKTALTDPDEIRQSKSDKNVLLFYRKDEKRWVCAVTRRLNGEGFLITAYPTDAIKEGEQIWNR